MPWPRMCHGLSFVSLNGKCVYFGVDFGQPTAFIVWHKSRECRLCGRRHVQSFIWRRLPLVNWYAMTVLPVNRLRKFPISWKPLRAQDCACVCVAKNIWICKINTSVISPYRRLILASASVTSIYRSFRHRTTAVLCVFVLDDSIGLVDEHTDNTANHSKAHAPKRVSICI